MDPSVPPKKIQIAPQILPENVHSEQLLLLGSIGKTNTGDVFFFNRKDGVSEEKT